MAGRGTRERILDVSLAMFNAEGEPNVSTNHIADELEISPGNLYYHFRNKDDIVDHLLARFDRRMDEVLISPEDRLPELDDIWLQLHLIFETIREYRFLYRDLVDLCARNRKLRMHFARLIKRKEATAEATLKGLVEAEVVTASRQELRALATAIAQTTTFWLSFQSVRGGSRKEEDDLAPGIYQVMLLVAPFVREPERAQLSRLASAYLS